jgi:hypothetical protein
MLWLADDDGIGAHPPATGPRFLERVKAVSYSPLWPR